MIQAFRTGARRPPRSRKQAGMTTAEYAVGTVSACGFAAVLLKLLTGEFGQSLLKAIFEQATSWIPGL
jgi:hypothetical protein